MGTLYMWSGFAPDMIAVYEHCSTVHSIIVDQSITSNLATASTYSATHALPSKRTIQMIKYILATMLSVLYTYDKL